MQIRIEKKVSLDDIFLYYNRLERFAELQTPIDLLLPVELENSTMGLVPAIYQFAFTWIRYPFARKLLLDITGPDQMDLSELFENEHLFPIIMLAWNKTGIYAADGETNLKPYLKEPAGDVRANMVKIKPMKGWKLLLTSIDHFPASSGLIPGYETTQGFIDHEANTFRNLKAAFDSILLYSKLAKNAFDAFEKDFVAIIHELLKNTHEWGKMDTNNVPIDPSVRGILVKFYKKRRSTFISESQLHKGLTSYFNSDTLQENAQNELYLLEISVYDCGIGFIDKFKAADKDQLSDVQIIKRCLIRHMTSATGMEKEDKGIGLDRILHVLDRKGFFKIQTHHSCLYRNLISHPYQTVKQEKDLELFDWTTNSNTDYKKLSHFSGSTITILYPLATNQLL